MSTLLLDIYSLPPQPPGARRNVRNRESGNDGCFTTWVINTPVVFGHKISQQIEEVDSS